MKQYGHITRLLSSSWRQKRWRKRKVVSSLIDRYFRRMPNPISYQTLDQFVKYECERVSQTLKIVQIFFSQTGLKEIETESLKGAVVNIDRVLNDLIERHDPPEGPVPIQILGDAFRAMRKIQFVNVEGGCILEQRLPVGV